MDLAAFPDLAARFRAHAAFRGGQGSSWVVTADDGPAQLLLKLLEPGTDLREAGLLASLVHPRVPRVLEVGTTRDGRGYLLRTLAPGRSLAEMPVPSAEAAVALFGSALETLAFVHLRGILHLDLKPANLVVDDRDGRGTEAWLLDFGLGQRGRASAHGGTPFFAAPEQLLGLGVDERTDLFAVGATIVAVLIPAVRTRGATFLRRFPSQDFLAALDLAPADLPAPFDRLVPRLVARRPADRVPTAQDALEALLGGGSGRPSTAALAVDVADAHAGAIAAALRDLPAGTDLWIDGADAADREAVGLRLACELGDVRHVVAEGATIRLDRGAASARRVVLGPLAAATLAAHLGTAVGLDAAAAATAARALVDAGATTAASAQRLLDDLVARGQLVPDGVRWSWPDALSGRLDRSPLATPHDPPGLMELAASGRIEAATRSFRAAIASHPDDEQAWREAFARGLLRAGEPLRALPLVHDLPTLRARGLLELGRLDAAAEVIGTMTDGQRDLDEVRRVEAALRYERGAFDAALAALDLARRDDPDNRIVRAYALTALGRTDAAETELGAALESLDADIAPFPRAAALTARGELARRRGAIEDARTQHGEALALYRRLGNARNTASASSNLGVALKDLGRFDDARDALRRARSLYAHVEDAAGTLIADANLGIVQLAAGDAHSAVDRFDRAIPGLRELGVTRSDSLLRAMRARGLALIGDASRARRELDELDREPDLDARVRTEIAAARATLAPPATASAQEPQTMNQTTEAESVPSTVFRSFLAINRRLASEVDLEKAMQHLLEAAETLTGARASYLLVERDGVVRLELASRIGPSGDRAFSRSLANKAISARRTMTAEDAVADRDLMTMPSVQDLRLRSALCVPFRSASDVVGALYVEHPGRRGAFGDREAEFLEALADQAAIAVERMFREEELARALETTRRDLAVATRGAARRRTTQLIGQSPAIDELRRQIGRFARSELAVLVQGETGTGKELVARMLHDHSPRASGPFVSENCSAIPADLMESELFGHVRGAFTGAEQDRPGLLELATGGTLFLDEVGDMPLDMQVKLLRALQEQKVRRVGGRESISIDLRLVSATHRDLRAMIEDGTFREDLYFRVAAGVVRVPPLRERAGDAVLLARHFVARLNEQHRRNVTIDDAIAGRLAASHFPGNVRELEHVIARAYLLTDGDRLRLDEDLARTADATTSDTPWPALTLSEATYRTIHAALRTTGGDKTAAAKVLGISRTALYEKLKRERAERAAEE